MNLLALPTAEPYLDKHGLAEYFAHSYRWVEDRAAEGMPHSLIGHKLAFKVSEVEPWLEEQGHIERRNHG